MMQHNANLSGPLIVLAFVLSMPLQAAVPISLQDQTFKQLQQRFHVTLSNAPQAIKAITDDGLQIVGEHTDEKNISHMRLQQEYAGFPVFGGYGILHSQYSTHALLSNRPNSVSMNGVVYEGLAAELGRPPAQFIGRAQTALLQFQANFSDKSPQEAQVTPLVYVDEAGKAFWAYKVAVLIRPLGGIPERPTAIIDAQSFKPFEQWNDIKTRRALVKGQGFGGNNRTGLYQFGVDKPYLMLSRDVVSGVCYMRNKDVNVIDMQHDYYSSKTMSFNCQSPFSIGKSLYWTGYGRDGYDLVNGAFSPSNDALYIGSIIKEMYSKWYGVHVLASNGRPITLTMRVHYGKGYDNAFWDGKQMTFGDGNSMMYPLVSLSVGAHEISHGFTEQHADLNYFGQSGGMNESFSDMAAQAAEFYSGDTNNWEIGGEIMKESSGYGALRYMDKPSRDGMSIDSADQYRKGMDVHYSSGVYNRLFYLLSNQPGWSPREAFHVMLKANMDYWTPYSNFNEGACGVLSAAHDLGLSTELVKKSLDDVAINYLECAV